MHSNKFTINFKKPVTFLAPLFCLSMMVSTPPAGASNASISSEASIKKDLSNPDCIKILSIDGGGIRGIIPLYVLQKLEKEMGKPIASLFDVIAGTSTGGIIALALATPADPKDPTSPPKYTPTDLLDLYTNHGDRIFGKRHKKWFSFGGLTRPRYSSKGLERVADDLFGDAKLSDSLTDVIVTSFATERDKPLIFNSYAAKQKEGKDFRSKDIAAGTSSAPTFFKPKVIKNEEGKTYTIIDGGVILNNPTQMALACARRNHPTAKDFLIVSLGTGKAIKRLHYDTMKRAGGIKWVKPLTSIMMDGVATSVHFQMDQLFPDEYLGQGAYKKRYYRFQPTILAEDKSMDKVDKRHIRSLKLSAEHALEERKKDIASLVELLRELDSGHPQPPLIEVEEATPRGDLAAQDAAGAKGPAVRILEKDPLAEENAKNASRSILQLSQTKLPPKDFEKEISLSRLPGDGLEEDDLFQTP